MDMNERAELYEGLDAFLERLITFADSQGLHRLAGSDLTMTQIRTLFLISVGGPLPINQAADHLGKSTTATGRSVDHLVRLGYLERHESPEDRRVKLVSITAEGRAVADQHEDSRGRALRMFIERLPDEDVHALLSALRPIVAGDYLDVVSSADDGPDR